jgi:hypothetical protein
MKAGEFKDTGSPTREIDVAGEMPRYRKSFIR